MSSSITRETGEAIQHQWVDSEFNQTIQAQIFKTIDFLNQFDRDVSTRLSNLDQRIEYLDKRLGYLEYAVRPVN
eukprot:g954.t1